MNKQELIAAIQQWGIDRNIPEGATTFSQLNKTFEEAGELFSAINRNNTELMKDAIGDIYVTLLMAESCSNIGHISDPAYHIIHMMKDLAWGSKVAIKDSMQRLEYVAQDLLGLDITECLQVAYDEIKDRKGKMVDGIFIKEGDTKCISPQKS